MFRVLWNLECRIGLSQKGIYAHFNEGSLAQFGVFEFSMPKVAQIGSKVRRSKSRSKCFTSTFESKLL